MEFSENTFLMEKLLAFSKYWNYDYRVAYTHDKKHWTKWIKLSEWNESNLPNYREILPSEIVWEHDDPNKTTNQVKATNIGYELQNKGIGHYIAFTGNKSYHIHAFFPQLKDIPSEKRQQAKEILSENLISSEWRKGLDKANFRNGRLIQIENTPNPKTGIKKTLFRFYEPEKNNLIPPEIIQKINEVKELNHKNTYSATPFRCLFVEYACKNKLPSGTDRNGNLIPNIVAINSNLEVWEQCAKIQDKPVSEFINWSKRKPKFCCSQLRKYAKSIGQGNICDMHLMEVLK